MILGFKGFKPGLIATLGDGSYQYQPGEVSKTEKAKCANTGFHYCLDPLDCLNWYAWNGKNEFWAIAAGGDIDEDDYRTRSSCTEIVPLRRLKEDEFLLMHANYVFEHSPHYDQRLLQRNRRTDKFEPLGSHLRSAGLQSN